MPKPVFILSPGAWHTAEVYVKVIPYLEDNGHKTVTHEWPSVIQAPVGSFDADIESIREAVIKEADAGNDIVVVSHSWSGSPVNSAVADLSKAERAKEGKSGGVVKIAFLCAFLVPAGVSLLAAMGNDPTKVPIWNRQVCISLESNSLVYADRSLKGDLVYPNDGAHHFYLDLPEEDQRHWVSKLRAHSWATKAEPSRGAAYMTIPSYYLICEDDNAIPLVAQEAMTQAAKDAGADITIERMKSSHSPFLSHPKETAEFLMRAAS